MDAGIEISLRIGQHVVHRNYKGHRVIGKVRGLALDHDGSLKADVLLDAPIVLPARDSGAPELKIWHQLVPAHELAPFDDRDEVIAAMLSTLREVEAGLLALGADELQPIGDFIPTPLLALRNARAAIAKAEGAAS